MSTNNIVNSTISTTQVSSNATYYPILVSSSTNGNQAAELNTGLTFNPQAGSSGELMLSGTGNQNIFLKSTSTTNGEGAVYLQRAISSSGCYAQLHFQTGGTENFAVGLRTGDSNLHFFDAVAGTDRMIINTSGNVAFFGSGSFGGGGGVISLSNATTTPTSNPSGGGILYTTAGALHYLGSSGTNTTVGTADPHCPECGSDFGFEWENEKFGGNLRICASCFANEFKDRKYIRWNENKKSI